MAQIRKLTNLQKSQAAEQRKNVARQRVLELVIRKQSKQLMLFQLIKDDKKALIYKGLLATNRRKLAILIKNNSYLAYDKNRLQIKR
ncbi:MAG: hypothetical protein ABF913_04800 [Oenococcus sp.]|uniref:hypothetical protein n=1 Tax=Oenococcus sp. TaxID=1979414 RepID=UPI0039ED8B2D